MDEAGRKNKSSMTAAGWKRARNLVGVFDPCAGGPSSCGLPCPATIFAAGATSDGKGLRTRETVAPLSAELGVAVNTDFGKGQEQALVEQVTNRPGPTLICWQHSAIPTIAHAFPSVTPVPPANWPADRFDVVWTFTKTVFGWRFAQVPELALVGDRESVIR